MAEDGTPRLTDFGVAHIGSSDMTSSGLIIGTYAYLSPESLNGLALDARADIWAFGVLLFEMLAGRSPFAADNPGAVMRAILTTPVPDLEALRPDAPVALVDLTYRMLEKDRERRIGSIRLVGAELEAMLRVGEMPSVSRALPQDSSTRADTSTIFTAPASFEGERARHNLPAHVTEFVGREAELTELAKLLASTRLVTIVGPGGIGKTRLVQEAAAGQIDTFANGVYFVSLAPLSAPELLESAIAEAMRFSFYGSTEPKQQLLDYLRSKRMLLLLDNFEHLLAGVGLVTAIVEAAPGVKILATSRERLNVEGETIFRLEGMDFPDWETPEDAAEYSAVKLFLQSARRVQPEFALDLDSLKYVARICRLVQGMPLGILLAAAWVEALQLPEIAEEIDKSLGFLETDRRDVPARHRSLRTAFEYSWNLLTDSEREVFKKLSVFRGGFTREAAQQIAGASLKALMRLVNKSLLRRNASSGRYDMHELLRQYGAEQLETSGETAVVWAAHSAYYMDFLARRDADVKGRRQMAALNEIRSDFENIRAAWQWAQDQRQDSAISQAINVLVDLSDMTSALPDVLAMMRQTAAALAPAAGDLPILIWEQVVVRREWLSYHLAGQVDHLLVEAILHRARERGDNEETAWCLWVLLDHASNHATANLGALAQEHLVLRRVLGDAFYTAHALIGGYIASSFEGQVESAVEYLREAIAIRRNLGDKHGLCLGLVWLAQRFLHTGRFAESETSLAQALVIQEELGKTLAFMGIMAYQASLAFWRGNFESATQLVQAGLEFFQDQEFVGIRSTSLAVLSYVASMSGDYAQGWEFCKQAEKPSGRGIECHVEWGMALASCGSDDDKAAWQRVQNTLRNAHKLKSSTFQMLCLPLTAILSARSGDTQRAVELLGLAFTAPHDLTGWMERWSLLKGVRADLEDALGPEAYRSAWERGESLNIDMVVSGLRYERDSEQK